MLFKPKYGNLEDIVELEEHAKPVYESSSHKVPTILSVHGKSKNSGKKCIVSYNQFDRYDRGDGKYLTSIVPYAYQEDAATRYYDYFGIPCQRTELVIDKNQEKCFQTCVIAEDILNDNEELIYYNNNTDYDPDTYRTMRNKLLSTDLKTFLETLLDEQLGGVILTDVDREQIIRDEVRRIFASILIGNNGWVTTLSLVHNKETDAYKAAPAYFNKDSFMDGQHEIDEKVMCDIYKYYPDYITDLQEKAQNLKDNYKIFAPKTDHKDNFFGNQDESYKFVVNRCYFYMKQALIKNQENNSKSI